MKRYRHFLSTFILFLISSFLLVGCNSPRSADLVALDFYDLIVKQTTNDSLIELGFPKELGDQTTSHLEKTLQENIQSALTIDDSVAITQDQLEGLTTAYLEAIRKLKATALVISYEGSKKCTVELTTSYLDYKAIDENATQEALKMIDISTYTDENLYLKDLMNLYIEQLIKGYKAAIPSEDHKEDHTKNFEFVLENKVWVPANYNQFLSTICTMIAAQP